MDISHPSTEEGKSAAFKKGGKRMLNQQIMDLESRNASLLSELSTSSRSTASSSSGPFLPRAPSHHTLTSHRAPITRVSFHPTWTVLASASEDSTVKIWDWESGDFERTVKGHTKAVMDVDFDPKGNIMGESLDL
jgi:platelet-activating factor acetylhydrolase IB subunit alpha